MLLILKLNECSSSFGVKTINTDTFLMSLSFCKTKVFVVVSHQEEVFAVSMNKSIT